MASQRNEMQNLIAKYQNDIAMLEEKEEDLTRRIQVMENIIPVVIVWYMWKIAQTNETEISSKYWSEEEAQKQLLHLETILEEVQEAEFCLKEEEKIMRKRVEELESPTVEVFDELRQEMKDNEAARERKRIKALQENKILFQNLLEDPKTDWIKTSKDLCEKVNDLKETLEDTSNELKNKENYIKQLKYDLNHKGNTVDNTEEWEKKNKAFVSEFINREQERNAEEAYMNQKAISAVKEAMGEVETIKKSLITKKTRKSEKENKDKTNAFHPLQSYNIEDEEEELSLHLETNKTIDAQQDFFKKPLVLTPDEVLIGSQKSPSRSSIPLPQIFEALETKKEPALYDDSVLRLRNTSTGTEISLPPDFPEIPPLNPEYLPYETNSPLALRPAAPILLDFEETQPGEFIFFGVDDENFDLPVFPPLSPDYEDFERHSSENNGSVIKTNDPTSTEGEPTALSTPEAQVKVPSSAHKSSLKSLDNSNVPSTIPEGGKQVPNQKQSLERKPSLAAEMKPVTTENLKDQPEILTKASLGQSSIKEEFPVEPAVLLQQSPTRLSQVSKKRHSSKQIELPEINDAKLVGAGPQSDQDPAGLVSGENVQPFPLENTVLNKTEPQSDLDHPGITTSPDSETVQLGNTVPIESSMPKSNQPGLMQVAAPELMPEMNAVLNQSKLPSDLNHQDVTSGEASERIPVELNSLFIKSELQTELDQPRLSSYQPVLAQVAMSEQIPSTSKAAADTLEAQGIMSEPSEAIYKGGNQLPVGSVQQLEEATLELRPSAASLSGQALESKCRVKDHLIRTMADQLKDLARRNVWSGNKLFKDMSSDPVKTYDFDRATLYKYIKGQEPKDLAPTLKSNEPYSSSNPLNVKVGRKLDKDSLLLEWGPSPSQEVVGFQIFVNGEFKYWVHSAKRSKALLHPVDLASRLEITVSPINSRGDVVHRSSVTYIP